MTGPGQPIVRGSGQPSGSGGVGAAGGFGGARRGRSSAVPGDIARSMGGTAGGGGAPFVDGHSGPAGGSGPTAGDASCCCAGTVIVNASAGEGDVGYTGT